MYLSSIPTCIHFPIQLSIQATNHPSKYIYSFTQPSAIQLSILYPSNYSSIDHLFMHPSLPRLFIHPYTVYTHTHIYSLTWPFIHQWSICQSNQLSIHPCMYPFIPPSVHLFFQLSIDLSILLDPFIHLTIRLLIHQGCKWIHYEQIRTESEILLQYNTTAVHRIILLSIHPTINSTSYLFSHPSITTFIHLSSHSIILLLGGDIINDNITNTGAVFWIRTAFIFYSFSTFCW